MYSYYTYHFVEPLLNEYVDLKDTNPDLIIPATIKGYSCEVAFFSDIKKKIIFVRTGILNLTSNLPDNKMDDILFLLREHSLSVLRLTFDYQIIFSQMTTSSFYQENDAVRLSIKLSESINTEYAIDFQNIEKVFCNSFDMRDEISKLSDSVNIHIPVQYRFLALWKIIESYFKNGDKFDSNKFVSFLEKNNIQLTKSRIYNLRDKCAHQIGRKSLQGISHLNRLEVQEIIFHIKEMQKMISLYITANNPSGLIIHFKY